MPSREMRTISRASCSVSVSFSPEAGSSISSSVGCSASARAISTRRWWPNDSSVGSRLSASRRPTKRRHSSAVRRASSSSRRTRGACTDTGTMPAAWKRWRPLMTLSSTVMLSNSCRFWNVRPTPSAAISFGSSSSIARPRNVTLPPSTG